MQSVPHEKLVVGQLTYKFLTFYRYRKVTFPCRVSCHQSLASARLPSYPIPLRSFLILSSDLSSIYFLQNFSTRYVTGITRIHNFLWKFNQLISTLTTSRASFFSPFHSVTHVAMWSCIYTEHTCVRLLQKIFVS